MTIFRGLASLAMMAFIAPIAGCGDERKASANPAPPPAPKVTVAKPVKRLVADTEEYVGRFVAFDQVEIRARVSGYLDEIHFTDGELVKAGDRLFTIDSRPFVAARDQARAALANAQSTLTLAQRELERAESLTRGTVISQGTFDQRIQAMRGAEASVAAQEAAVRQAELDIAYSKLDAPISGRIGDRRVSVGNLVTGGLTGNATVLATIVTVDPIRFEFTLDEASYLRFQQAMNGALAKSGADLKVRLKLINEQDFVHEGKLDFVDNALDRASGTIRGRALFPNTDGKFLPGMFGRVQLAASAPAEALLVPDAAIGTEQVRKFVYTVDGDNVATPKYVTLGPVVAGMRVVTAGLEPDDDVVVNGLMRVRPGTKVQPERATAEAADGRTATTQ